MGHDHHHDHSHDHHHGHDHHAHAYEAGGGRGRPFAIGIALNLSFVLVEVWYGFISHSVALLADAGHNLGDVLSLGLSWGATALATLKPSSRRTFGFRRTTIVASVANALILLFVTGGLTWESLRRLVSPEPAQGKTMIVVAVVGAVINAASALLFMADRKRDLNLRSAFLHLASDAVISLGDAFNG
jgi:cobalt-zinc-cadmium efflux system protein